MDNHNFFTAMKKIFLLLAIALVLPMAASAQKMVPAFVMDSKGPVTNIRTAPNAKAKVAMTLPTDKGSYELLLGEVKNGWWKIEDNIYEAEENAEVKLHGSKTGYWIHNSIVGFGIAGEQDDALYAKPSKKARMIKVSPGDVLYFHPLEVRGNWVKVVSIDGRYTGWMLIDRICSNSLTTCP